MTRLFTLLLFFLSVAVRGQSAPADETEAPEALFDQKIGDVGVVLEASGTWTTRLAGGWGLGFSPQGVLPGLGYPGFEKGGVFVQQPDFTLTLRLLERYYLSVIYGGTLEDRSFLVGYDGREGEAIQWVKAGNAPFSVPGRAGQTVTDGRKGAAAAGASAVFGPVSLEVLGRYDDGTRETKSFQGFRETSVDQVGLDAWIHDRFFRLPASELPATGLRVEVDDGGSFRAATPAEAAVDATTGEIALTGSATKTYLVTWDAAAAWSKPASPTLGIAAVPATGSGPGTWFELVRPGAPSRFELRNRYPVPAGTNQAIALVNRDTGGPVEGFTIGQAPNLDWFEVSGDPEAPFVVTAPGLYPGSSAPPQAASLAWVFRLPRTNSNKGLSLGSDVLPSSLVVVRNGIPTTDFHFDADSGLMTFDTPIYDSDQIEISLQRAKAGGKASDLQLWQGGRWALASDHAIEWALQGRWNMEQGRFTTEDLQAPGRVSASLSYQGKAGEWSWRAQGTGGALLTDSTGHRRLYGLASGGTTAAWDSDSLRPSAAPGLGALLGSPLTNANRAPLAFRNYWTNDPLTGTPDLSAWRPSGVSREAPGADGWMGPYLVRGDGTRTDRVAVIEADPSPGEWLGLQAYLDQGKARDLRATTAISVTLRVPGGVVAGDRIVLQAGTVSENWDGTGAVRSVEYRSLPTIAFYDQALQQRKYFPVPENSAWGNDGDHDGTAGSDGALVTEEITGAGDAWTTARFLLTDAERQLLQRTTGWRLVYLDANGSSARTVLVGPVTFEGSTWSVTAESAGVGKVNPVEEADPSDVNHRELRVDWVGRSSWSVEGRHSPVRPGAYRSIGFRYRASGITTGSTLALSLTDPAGHGLNASWPLPADTGWTDAKIDLTTSTMAVAGITVGTVSIDEVDPWDRLTIRLVGGSTSGQLVVADIEATDPVWEPLATSQVSTRWTQAHPWPSTDLPLVSGLVWDVVSQQSGTSSTQWRGRSALAGMLGPVKASGEVTVIRTPREASQHGSYETTVPLGWSEGPRLEWTDRFSDTGQRSERVMVALPWVGTWNAHASIQGPPYTLDQEYGLGWKADTRGLEGWKAGFDTKWYQTVPHATRLDSFASVWYDSWSWLTPANSVPFYTLSADASGRGQLGPWAFELKNHNQVTQSLGAQRKWAVVGDWDVRLPWSPEGEAGWKLTPSVSKSVSGVIDGLADRTPAESAKQGLIWLWSRPASLGTLPFAEEFSAPWQEQENLRSGLVQTSVALDWNRPVISDWTDVVIPGSATATATLARGGEETAEYRSTLIAARLQAKALNVFGTLGSNPLFDWYRTDVWTWSTSASLGTGTRVQDQKVDGSVSVRSDLVLTPRESLGLPVAYQGVGGATPSHSLKTNPTWTLRMPADLPFELPRWLSSSAFHREWVQDLGLALELGWQPVPAPMVRNLQVSWKGHFLLSDKSELAFTSRWGTQWQYNLTVVGLEAAIDLVLNF